MAASILKIKAGLVGISVVLMFVWLIAGGASRTAGSTAVAVETEALPSPTPDDRYVGSETCAACHEPQFKSVSGTKHGNLHTISSWKNKVVGCEACHGPGREHAETQDPTKILVFKRMDAKTASETCLSCHAGKENHNNFRRGDHWKNNVGCTECHAAHGPEDPKFRPGSIAFAGERAALRPAHVTTAMLKMSEPQLCMSCHNETKSQFSKPFRHKVLEGTMNCSDCHNPHGGFEQKQARLAVGADAACIKCHSNKQGPFVFEHAALKLEGCAACHTPHGSANPKMLKRSSVRQLCIECHTSITNADSTDTLPAPIPTFHNQANNSKYRNCLSCHAAIHGSNADRFFFR